MIELPALSLTLSPRWPGGEGRVRGADGPVNVAAHLTLPSLSDGSLPRVKPGAGSLPPEGRRGAIGAGLL
jgi:hypothetical protein